jgi:uncharacterized protein YjbI with pentapeptide repeats
MEQEPKDKDEASAGNPWLRPPKLIYLIVIVVLLIVDVILFLYPYAWAGFGERRLPSGEILPGKTLWDWMELFIVAATLGVIGYFFNNAQKARDEEESARRDRLEMESADKRAQEAALQTYLDQMSELLIERSLSSNPTPETHNVARVWTLTTVRRLNGERKGKVLEFLQESNLIQGDNPTIALIGADLSEANLSGGVVLFKANLIGADLSKANLSKANLNGANLIGANLSKANLIETDFSAVDFSRFDFNELSPTDLVTYKLVVRFTFLGRMLLSSEELSPENQSQMNVQGADLSGADLSGADLSGADLSGADLSGADLSGAKYTMETIWPAGFDPARAGATLVESP